MNQWKRALRYVAPMALTACGHVGVNRLGRWSAFSARTVGELRQVKLQSAIFCTSLLVAVVSLSACGGGGADDAEAPPPSAPPEVQDPGFVADATTGKVVLYSANGDLQKYMGRWESGCTVAQVSAFNPARSFINVYQFTNIQNASVKGEFTQFQFTDPRCVTKTSPASVKLSISLNSIRVDAVPSHSSSFSGFLDSMNVSYVGTTLFDQPDFMAFSEGYKNLLIGQVRGLGSVNWFDAIVYSKK